MERTCLVDQGGPEMTHSARDLLERIQAELAPHDDDNRLVPLISAGKAPKAVFAAIATEEKRITLSDWRSFQDMADRADEPNARLFFGGLAQGVQQTNGWLDAVNK